VRSSEAVDKIIAETIREHAGLDILVNNAGISDGRANALETTDELLDMVLDVNLRGAVYATRAALRFMAERKSGRIINVASIAGVAINGLPYTISKFGMAGLTRHTAVHFGATGVTVNAICRALARPEPHLRLLRHLRMHEDVHAGQPAGRHVGLARPASSSLPAFYGTCGRRRRNRCTAARINAHPAAADGTRRARLHGAADLRDHLSRFSRRSLRNAAQLHPVVPCARQQ
jgi:meso-butanediol dehydrogenase/(S,S)-butanediol dehydrogenase/diacetyl reductase